MKIEHEVVHNIRCIMESRRENILECEGSPYENDQGCAESSHNDVTLLSIVENLVLCFDSYTLTQLFKGWDSDEARKFGEDILDGL